jgi:hypothetical protein
MSSEAVHRFLGYGSPLFGRQYTERVQDARGSHLALRYDHRGASGRWQADVLPPGQVMNEPTALFVKLDDAVMREKLTAMGYA